MTGDNKPAELLRIAFTHPMPYEWSIGLYGSRFFQEIAERRRFIGIRCDGCGKVYAPPRRVCGPCFRELTELVPLGDTGILTAFSVVNYPFLDPDTGSQRPIPYTYGYIRLDGSDSIFSHIINETDPGRLRVGMRVRAVFREKGDMEGNIRDIRYFEIIE
jgi:uncharacterized OB-fold protein